MFNHLPHRYRQLIKVGNKDFKLLLIKCNVLWPLNLKPVVVVDPPPERINPLVKYAAGIVTVWNINLTIAPLQYISQDNNPSDLDDEMQTLDNMVVCTSHLKVVKTIIARPPGTIIMDLPSVSKCMDMALRLQCKLLHRLSGKCDPVMDRCSFNSRFLRMYLRNNILLCNLSLCGNCHETRLLQ